MREEPRRLLARLAAAVMIADGRITPDEVAAAELLDHIGLGTLSPLVAEEVERSVEVPIDLAGTCRGLADTGSHGAGVILSALAEIAASDGEVSDTEGRMIGRVGRELGLADGTVDSILESAIASHRATVGEAPRRASPTSRTGPQRRPSPRPTPVQGVEHARLLLGVGADATAEDVERAYLALVERLNPVKVMDFGAEFVALAARKLGIVTAAFETVRRSLPS